MKIAIVSGSSRKDSESLRVAKYLAERIDLETDLISLEGNPLDLWSDEVYSSEAFLGLQKEWQMPTLMSLCRLSGRAWFPRL